MKIGITGQSGFIGSHLYNYLGTKQKVKRIPFKDEFFEDKQSLDNFIKKCDAIVHLAALNRHGQDGVIYKTNVGLVNKLIESVRRTDSRPHIIMSSSTQENSNNEYGKSKRKGRELFVEWARESNGQFTGLIIPNVFGPLGKPFYNSVVSTFSYQITHDEKPEIHIDAKMALIYVQDLIEIIYEIIKENIIKNKYMVGETGKARVSEVLQKFKSFNETYVKKGVFPDIGSYFDQCLFNTFRSYLEPDFFPFELELHTDERGSFAEAVRAHSKGQTSFSVTRPGIVRGNHFHIRNIERFCVIKGNALIKIRKVGHENIFTYRLSGKEPAYVDIPVWHTHNIKNIGSQDLYTIFWINGFFDPDCPDTYFKKV